MGDDVHARRVEPNEERLSVFLCFLDEAQGEAENLVIDGLHPVGAESPGILDALLPDFSPSRLNSRVVLAGRPAVNHVTGPNSVNKRLWVVPVARVFHRVEVVQVTKEL